jgi:Na+/H+ antiporter NhaD/arsenite permease-like protein
VNNLVNRLTAMLPVPSMVGRYFLCLSFIPLLGSFITEPAAMTLSALLLRDMYCNPALSNRFKYGSLSVLLVNISIGGVLTPYAAPPVLMVAEKWGWDLSFMMSVFGWKAAIAVLINAVLASVLFKKELLKLPAREQKTQDGKQNNTQLPDQLNAERCPVPSEMPLPLIAVHLLFLFAIVWFSHHPAVFIGLFLFFLGFTHAYPKHQSKLMLKEGLLVGFFLGGLVVLGGLQQWWLQPLISNLHADALFFGATALTALTDNAALTYLGSLVEGISDSAKYALVCGAVTGGGLTVIANAPNPAGFAILKGCFDEESISPLNVFLAALAPTLVAGGCFYFF